MTLPPPLSTIDDAALLAVLDRLGEPSWRARQLRAATWQPYVDGFASMKQLAADTRSRLERELAFSSVETVEHVDTDGGMTVKLLVRLRDGSTVETVAMETPARAPSQRRATVCVSTQVGCAVGCPFCATGRLGLRRNCSAAEIVDQVRAAGAALHARGAGPVTHVVYMGMGEPLANYAATIESLRVLTTRARVSARRITVSTSGVVPKMDALAADAPAVTLAISLHAATDELRDRLVPLNRAHPIAELTAAGRRYAGRSGRRVSFEWCLISGVNDSTAQADALLELSRASRAHVNIIPMNRIEGSEWGPPDPSVVRAFLARLRGVRVTVRDTRGDDIAAACGQLRASLEARREQLPDGTLGPPRRLVHA